MYKRRLSFCFVFLNKVSFFITRKSLIPPTTSNITERSLPIAPPPQQHPIISQPHFMLNQLWPISVGTRSSHSIRYHRQYHLIPCITMAILVSSVNMISAWHHQTDGYGPLMTLPRTMSLFLSWSYLSRTFTSSIIQFQLWEKTEKSTLR